MRRRHQADAAHYRELAGKIRDLARARIAEIIEDLLDLAEQLDRMAELAEKSDG